MAEDDRELIVWRNPLARPEAALRSRLEPARRLFS